MIIDSSPKLPFLAEIPATMTSSIVYTAAGINGSSNGPQPTITCDLRSDTVTKPCKAMREAMMTAEVGDDVMGEDPTVKSLESRVAELCGKEAGLFVTSSTLANQLAVMCAVGPMESLICDYRCHVFCHEAGGVAMHSRATIIPVRPPPGKTHITVETIAESLLADDIHHAVTGMIEVENTLGGSIFPLSELQRIKKYAEAKRLTVHMDGARLWTASIASGVPISQYCAQADTVALCFSKTLGCPVGAVLVGTKDTIARANRFRKVMGGGWRQAGILAAAGLYALDHNWLTLKDVHERTAKLAIDLKTLGFKINEEFGGAVDTNMIFADIAPITSRTKLDWAAVAQRLRSEGIVIGGPPAATSTVNRLVIHHQATANDLQRMVNVIGDMIGERGAPL